MTVKETSFLPSIPFQNPLDSSFRSILDTEMPIVHNLPNYPEKSPPKTEDSTSYFKEIAHHLTTHTTELLAGIDFQNPLPRFFLDFLKPYQREAVGFGKACNFLATIITKFHPKSI